MSKSQDDAKPYKYAYTFGPAKKEKPPEEMDIDVLEDYINNLLGTNGEPMQTK